MVLMISLGLGIGLGVFVAIVVVAGVGALVIREKIRKFSRGVFGTDSLIDGFNKQADELATTPKSVCNMTRLMEPLIVKDFPDFVWSQFARKAENMLTSALVAISTEDESKLVEASDAVCEQVRNIIEQNRIQNVREVYENIKIHQTAIAKYQRLNDKCVINIQSAVEYFHYKENYTKVIEGSKERKEQARYNMELVYVRNADAFEGADAVGVTCPSCGAPIRSVGMMACEFCGSAIAAINMEKVWKLHSFKKD